MIDIEKTLCLFFDQVNIYANYRRMNHVADVTSTDLSTVFVDKTGRENPRSPATNFTSKKLCDTRLPPLDCVTRFTT